MCVCVCVCVCVLGLATTVTKQWHPPTIGFAVRVRSAGQKYGPTCHQWDRADVTEFVTLVRSSSLGQHVGVLALAGYKRRKSALMAGPITVEVGLALATVASMQLTFPKELNNKQERLYRRIKDTIMSTGTDM